MNRGDRVENPLPAKGSKDRQRWECSCRAPLATRASDHKGVYYLQLLPGFDLHRRTGDKVEKRYYFKSHRPARRFLVAELPAPSPANNKPVPTGEAQSRIHQARNTDVNNRLHPKDMPAIVRCERCKRFCIIPSVGIPPS
jgi:hypothetical protein